MFVIVSSMLLSGSVLAHWTSPNGVSPTKEEILTKEVRVPSSVQTSKSNHKKQIEQKESTKAH